MMKESKDQSSIEKEIAETMVDAFLDQSEKIDKFSSWLLGGVGAAFIIFISNFGKNITSIGATQTKVIFCCFAISLLLGLVQKYLAYQVILQQGISYRIEEKEKELLQKHGNGEHKKLHEFIKENADPANIMALFISAFPKYMHKLITKSLEEDSSGGLAEKRRSLRSFMTQIILTFFQVLVVVTIILAFVISI